MTKIGGPPCDSISLLQSEKAPESNDTQRRALNQGIPVVPGRQGSPQRPIEMEGVVAVCKMKRNARSVVKPISVLRFGNTNLSASARFRDPETIPAWPPLVPSVCSFAHAPSVATRRLHPGL